MTTISGVGVGKKVTTPVINKKIQLVMIATDPTYFTGMCVFMSVLNSSIVFYNSIYMCPLFYRRYGTWR